MPTEHLRFQPVDGPALLMLGEEGEHEVVLRVEVPVEGHPRDIRTVDDGVDARGADSVARGEVVGRANVRSRPWGGRPRRLAAGDDDAEGMTRSARMVVQSDRTYADDFYEECRR